ncbi:MAG: hypothetical protein ACRD2G_01045 [Terriglobia bacterium]
MFGALSDAVDQRERSRLALKSESIYKSVPLSTLAGRPQEPDKIDPRQQNPTEVTADVNEQSDVSSERKEKQV